MDMLAMMAFATDIQMATILNKPSLMVKWHGLAAVARQSPYGGSERYKNEKVGDKSTGW